MLAMAFLATMTAVVSTGKVSADPTTDTSNIVRVSIDAYNGWVNSCSWSDYIFDLNASTQQQVVSINTWIVTCIFWNSTWKAVTLQLAGDLTHQSLEGVNIPKENIKLTNGTWTVDPSWLGSAGPSWKDTFYNEWWKTLFTKNANMIWDASGTNLSIEVTVPAWQPNGTYEWTLVLTF